MGSQCLKSKYAGGHGHQTMHMGYRVSYISLLCCSSQVPVDISRHVKSTCYTFFDFAWLTHILPETQTHKHKHKHPLFDPSVSSKTVADVPVLTLNDVSLR